MGAIFSQLDPEGVEHLIYYASGSCNTNEHNYSSFDGVCRAEVHATSHFRPYLYGNSFALVTDLEPLKWRMTTQKLPRKLAQWSLLPQDYDFVVAHWAGVEILNADCLIRYPLPSLAKVFFLDWAKGDVMALATFMSMMVGLANLVQGVEAVTYIWRDMGVMRFLQTHKYDTDLTASKRDRIYRHAKGHMWLGNILSNMLQHGALVMG